MFFGRGKNKGRRLLNRAFDAVRVTKTILKSITFTFEEMLCVLLITPQGL
jgi:hypothetical protein